MQKIVKSVETGKSNLPKTDIKLNQSSEFKKFWSRILADLQKLGKSLMFPIAILPFAALLNRFGSLAMELNPMVDGTRNVGNWIGFIMSTPGAIVFNNLALFFAIGTAFGLSKDNRGEAALVGAVLYIALTMFLTENGLASLFYNKVLQMDYWKQDQNGNWILAKGFSQLFYVPVFKQINPLGTSTGSLEVVGGQYILDIGVLGGIISGVMSAFLYNKYRDIKLPQALSFFGGRRFVPMMVMLTSLPLAFIFAAIWPWIQFGLVRFGQVLSSGDAWAVPGAFLYALINRFIQPFGLHHIINTFLWFQLPIVGNLVDVSGKIILGPDVLVNFDPANLADATEQAKDGWLNIMNDIASTWTTKVTITWDNWTNYFTYNTAKFGDSGILSMGNGLYGKFGDINAFQAGLISGNFQTGYFPMYWGGLTGAAVAMIMAAKKENRRRITAFLGGVAIVALLTGIDEPIVFSFIFVAPILWVYNAVFTAVFAAIAVAMHMHIGFGFSGGLIDYIISFASSWGMSSWEGLVNGSVYGVLSNPLWMLLLAGVMFPLYFGSFYFTIKKFDLKTPGREDVSEQVKVDETIIKAKGNDKYVMMAEEFIKIIGSDNIVKVDNCASRLRLIVKDNKVGSDEAYKAIGAYGVRRLGNEGLQIVIGTDVEFVANAMHDITKK